MSKVKNFILGTAMAASLIACNPKTNNDEGVRENIKKDLIEVFDVEEMEHETLYIKHFNSAILDHDIKKAIYNLGQIYIINKENAKIVTEEDGITNRKNAYGTLTQIKQFYDVFGNSDELKEIEEVGIEMEEIGPIIDYTKALRKNQDILGNPLN